MTRVLACALYCNSDEADCRVPSPIGTWLQLENR